jgi:thioredoxin 1
MGFIKRLLGLETKPGEPRAIDEASFDATVLGGEKPSFVYFFHLWCSSCQVMGGLLNEVGPEFADRAEFYKVNVHKEPMIASRCDISGVPALLAIRGGAEVDRVVGLVPLDTLRTWIEQNLDARPGATA